MISQNVNIPVVFSAVLCALPAQACDVAIGFAVDVSGSISDADYATQMLGLADGLRDPFVAHTLASGNSAALLILWSGHDEQHTAIDWVHLSTLEAVHAFADRVERTPRLWDRSATAIGAALNASVAAMHRAPACDRYVLDISGDGRSNEGALPGLQRAALDAVPLTVNAIVVDVAEDNLELYFREQVIHGADSFAVVATSFEDYASQMRLKLYRELAIQFAALDARAQ